MSLPGDEIHHTAKQHGKNQAKENRENKTGEIKSLRHRKAQQRFKKRKSRAEEYVITEITPNLLLFHDPPDSVLP